MASLKQIPGAQRLLGRTAGKLRRLAIWRAFWPCLVLLAVFVIAALAGAFDAAPKQIAAFASVLAAVGLIITGLRGWARYRRPDQSQVVKALDAQSDLRPISSLEDRPTRHGAAAISMWAAHQTRLADAIRRLKVPSFWQAWRRADPLFLRFVLPVVLVGLLAFNGAGSIGKLRSAVSPDIGSLFGADGIKVEAWITPPDYSGRAPLFLKDGQTEIRVPRGSVMTLRAIAPSAPNLVTRSESDREVFAMKATPDGAYEIETIIEEDASISVRWWGPRESWKILASPDSAPNVEFVEDPKLGEDDDTEFAWKADDDYGIKALALAIRPVSDPERDPDFVAVDLGASLPTNASDDAKLDLTRNRWAGARVQVWLRATDGADQIGESEKRELILPAKLLLQPMAKAVQDIRVTVLREDDQYAEAEIADDALVQDRLFTSITQRLERAPTGVRRASAMIEGVTFGPPAYFPDAMVYAGLKSAESKLKYASSTDQAKSTDDLLWALALRAEYGTAADALAALLAAKAALEEALRDGASEEEIRRRMEAFKEAAQRYIAARMAEALANGLDAPADNRDGAQSGGPGMGGQDFSDMLDALEDLTETGASDQARQLLSDITNMLENLEFQQGNGSGEGMPGQPGEQADGEDDIPEEERELTETMQELSDLLREQRELNDQTMAEQRGEREPGSEQGGQSGAGDEGDSDLPEWMNGSEDGRTLAEQQRELGNRTDELGDNLGEEGGLSDEDGEGGSSIDEDVLEAIERAQRRAGRALEDGNTPRALRNQEQATRQLRELTEGLAEELDELRAERLNDPDNVEEAAEAARDPFGNSSQGGTDDANSVNIPDEAERQRAKDILDELRRRYGDTLDEDEREYLERLLDRF